MDNQSGEHPHNTLSTLSKSMFSKSTLSKYLVYLLAAALIVVVLWRIVWGGYGPNLLVNPDFDAGELTGWEVGGVGSNEAVSKLSGHDADNITLELSIPDTSEGSWIGIGQRVSVEPTQPHNVSLSYRLRDKAQSSSTVVLRISQFDQAGQLITLKDVSPPDLAAGPTNDAGQATWHSLAHSFVTDEEATSVEIGAGLFGMEATTVEIDKLVLTADATWPEAIGQDPLILSLCLLLIGAIGFRLRLDRIFTRLPLKVSNKRLNGRLAALVGVNIILFFVLAELAALGIYFVRDGGLFYTNKKTYPLISQEQEGKLTEVRIHPYFGFSGMPGWIRQEGGYIVNNQGFFSDYDYPFIKSNQNQYIIGVFGGSVAEVMTMTAGDVLVETLKKDDFFADKEIIILNFAYGGYKQPQQLLILNYFLSIGQEFDMVINIDGFNEVSLGNENNRYVVDIAMPQVGAMNTLINLTDQTTLTPRRLESLARIHEQTKKLNSLATTLNNNRIASLNFILEQYYAFTLNNYQQEVIEFEEIVSGFSEASLLFVKPGEEVLADAVLFDRIAEIWATSSVMMNQILMNKNILYVHFLQPNQYYSHKTFGEGEAKQAFNENHPYRLATEKGYPVLIEKSSVLAENGVNFYNAIPVFDNELGVVYKDDCCHYTGLGYEILIDFMVDSILESEDFRENK